MKYRYLTIGFAFIALPLGACQRHAERIPTNQPAAHATPHTFRTSTAAIPVADSSAVRVGVNELMTHPHQYAGMNLAVIGVVSEVSHDRLELIDTKEFEECKSVSCSEHALPVAWKGAMPKVKEHVEIQGHIGTQSGRSIFIAERISALTSNQLRKS